MLLSVHRDQLEIVFGFLTPLEHPLSICYFGINGPNPIQHLMLLGYLRWSEFRAHSIPRFLGQDRQNEWHDIHPPFLSQTKSRSMIRSYLCKCAFESAEPSSPSTPNVFGLR